MALAQAPDVVRERERDVARRVEVVPPAAEEPGLEGVEVGHDDVEHAPRLQQPADGVERFVRVDEVLEHHVQRHHVDVSRLRGHEGLDVGVDGDAEGLRHPRGLPAVGLVADPAELAPGERLQVPAVAAAVVEEREARPEAARVVQHSAHHHLAHPRVRLRLPRVDGIRGVEGRHVLGQRVLLQERARGAAREAHTKRRAEVGVRAVAEHELALRPPADETAEAHEAGGTRRY